jgi:hypothetical protein
MPLPSPTSIDVTTRLEILDVLTRFCRGVDRHDRTLLESCYHPGATDDHGIYRGEAKGFIDWVLGATEGISFMQHTITNHLVLGAGDGVVTTETYYHARTLGADGELAHAFGRYLDRFERRDGEWRIAQRLCTMEHATPNLGYPQEGFERGSPDASDPSFALIDSVR